MTNLPNTREGQGTPISRSEREDLQRLVRQREKVLKSAAKERSAQLIAEFESQMAAIYSFDSDPIWAEAKKAAQREADKAQKQVAARCAELGIPAEFAPSLALGWFNRGQNALKERRAELRKVAVTRIAAIERQAVLDIERQSLESQTELAVAGLTSDAAKGFLERLPTVESLMPLLSFTELTGSAEPPVVEQLLSSNTLRQRRFRERQAALRNGPSNGREALRGKDDVNGGSP